MDVPRHFSGSAQLVGMGLGALAERGVGGRTVVLFPGEAGLPRALGGGTTFVYDDFAAYREDRETAAAWDDDGGGGAATLVFSHDPLANGTLEAETFDVAVVFLPKGREVIEHAFSVAGRLTTPGGTVLVAGPKKSGILSSRDLGEQHLGALEGKRSARHARLLTYRRGDDPPPPFDGERRYRTTAWDAELEVVSLPGVFSHGRLDDGTRFLLDHLPLPEWTTALDFGCGAGVLTASLLRARPDTRVDAVDASAAALAATRRTLAANGLEIDPPELDGTGTHATAAGGARVFPSDVLSDVAGPYDLVLTNPPFHSGHRTDFTATNRLIAEAGDRLGPRGELVMVTNTFIDYLTPLRRAFRQVEVAAETGRYRITRSRRPR